MLAILIWLIIGILNFVIISYIDFKRYDGDYSDLADLYISLAISILISPITLACICVYEIKYQFEKHKKE